MNHLHICAVDVAASQAFYERHFGFRKAFDHGEGVFIRDDQGFLIAIDPVSKPFEYPAWFHIGFMMDDPQRVRDTYTAMQAEGARFAKELTDYEGEALVFYCYDPGGTRIEVSWYEDE